MFGQKKSKAPVYGALAFLLFFVFTAPLSIFGGMKAYADECGTAPQSSNGAVNPPGNGTVRHPIGIMQQDSVKKNFEALPESPAKISMPVNNGYITSDFNKLDSAHTSPHNGTDFGSTGSAYAVVDGVVVTNMNSGSRGWLVAVAFKKDNKAYTYLYQHLASQSPKSIGDHIVSGEPIGTIGGSGGNYGIHLHAEVEFANMGGGYPSWQDTYPTNTAVMFDFLSFFNLPRSYNGTPSNNAPTPSGQNTNKQCSSSGTVTNLVGNTNAEKVWNELKKQGFTDEGAAGVIGNLMQESNCDPKKKELSGGPGRGIMQWTESQRWASLVKWAKSANKDEWELATQIEWLLKEMKDYGVIDKFKTFKNVKEATDLFEHKMEAAGIPVMENRYKFAYDALAKFKK